MTGSYQGRGGRVGTYSALPGGAHTPPRSPKKWKTAQPRRAASKEPVRMPTTAWSRSAESGNATSAMKQGDGEADPRQGGSTNELAALYRARPEAEPQPQS